MAMCLTASLSPLRTPARPKKQSKVGWVSGVWLSQFRAWPKGAVAWSHPMTPVSLIDACQGLGDGVDRQGSLREGCRVGGYSYSRWARQRACQPGKDPEVSAARCGKLRLFLRCAMLRFQSKAVGCGEPYGSLVGSSGFRFSGQRRVFHETTHQKQKALCAGVNRKPRTGGLGSRGHQLRGEGGALGFPAAGGGVQLCGLLRPHLLHRGAAQRRPGVVLLVLGGCRPRLWEDL